MSIYEEFAQTAVEMLAEFGTSATLSSPSVTFDKTTGRQTAASSSSQTVQTVLQDREVMDEAGRYVVRTVAILTVKPKLRDTLTLAGRSWQVEKVTEIQPTNIPIAYLAVLS